VIVTDGIVAAGLAAGGQGGNVPCVVFRRKRKLEERLAAGELRRARATVLKVHFLGGQGAVVGGVNTGRYHVRARVEPAGEAPFEVTFSYYAQTQPAVPHEGGTVPVAYDPDDRDSTIWDEDTARSEAVEARMFDRQRREQIAGDRRAQGLPPLGSEAEGPDPVLIAELKALQERKDRGELNDWQFRTARAELMKEVGF
jgi:hypothetical protein